MGNFQTNTTTIDVTIIFPYYIMTTIGSYSV